MNIHPNYDTEAYVVIMHKKSGQRAVTVVKLARCEIDRRLDAIELTTIDDDPFYRKSGSWGQPEVTGQAEGYSVSFGRGYVRRIAKAIKELYK